MIRHYVISIYRGLRKNVFFTFLNLLGLTTALTISLTIVAFVDYEKNFDHFHSNSDRIFRVVQQNHTANGVDYWSTTAYPLAEALRNDFPNIKVTQTAGPSQRLLTGGFASDLKNIEVENVLFVDSLFFSFFDFSNSGEPLWIQGDISIFAKQDNAVLLTKNLAEKFYGLSHGNIIGEEIELNKNSILTVAGVIDNPPKNTSVMYEAVVNYHFFKENNPYPSSNWSGNYQGYTYIMLPDHSSAELFEQSLPDFESKYLSDIDNKRIEYKMQPLIDIHNDTTYSDSIGSYTLSGSLLNGLMVMALIIIIIASVNYVNLTSALAIRRSKEVAIYKILGDSKGQLLLRHLLETGFLILVAAIHAIFFGQWILNFINEGLLGQSFDIILTEAVLFSLAGICLIIIIAAGIYPALIMASFNPIKAMKDNQNISQRGFQGFMRRTLVFIQFSLVHIIIIGVCAVYFQMSFLKNTDLGFEKEDIITINIPRGDSIKVERLRQAFSKHSAVTQVSFSSGIPFESDYQYGTSFRLSSESETMQREAEMKVVDVDYAGLFAFELVAGKWLTNANVLPWQQGFNGFVVNETLAKELGFIPEELIGQKITINEGEAEVIGVIKDYHNVWLKESIKPLLLFYWGTGFYSKGAVQLSTNSNYEESLAFIKKEWKKEFPNHTIKTELVEHRVDNTYAIDDFVFSGLQISSLVAIVLGCSGLFALVAFFTESKTKEMGIRKTLGASLNQLIMEMSSGFLWLVGISIIVGSALGWWFISQWLEGFTYRTELTYISYILAALATIVVAGISIIGKTTKAALNNPIESLRSE